MNNCCNKCPNPCGCPLRALSIKVDPARKHLVEFNIDGHSAYLDLREVDIETDTFLRVDSVLRNLKYLAEKHVSTISGAELGSILHLSDLGDVITKGVKQNSLLTFQKNSECDRSCTDVSNNWVAWNATDNQADSVETLFGFDEDDAPKSIAPPENEEQYYQLGWNGAGQVSYSQPVEVSVPTADSDGFAKMLFVNPATKQLETLKVIVNIDNSGNVTFKTQGSV